MLPYGWSTTARPEGQAINCLSITKSVVLCFRLSVVCLSVVGLFARQRSDEIRYRFQISYSFSTLQAEAILVSVFSNIATAKQRNCFLLHLMSKMLNTERFHCFSKLPLEVGESFILIDFVIRSKAEIFGNIDYSVLLMNIVDLWRRTDEKLVKI